MVTAKDYDVVSCHLELFSICVESNVVKVEMFRTILTLKLLRCAPHSDYRNRYDVSAGLVPSCLQTHVKFIHEGQEDINTQAGFGSQT